MKEQCQEAHPEVPTREQDLLDASMPAQIIRLHMGEMSAQELRTARAAIRWANAVALGKARKPTAATS